MTRSTYKFLYFKKVIKKKLNALIKYYNVTNKSAILIFLTHLTFQQFMHNTYTITYIYFGNDIKERSSACIRDQVVTEKPSSQYFSNVCINYFFLKELFFFVFLRS